MCAVCMCSNSKHPVIVLGFHCLCISQHAEPILDQYVISHRRLRLYFPAKTRL